MAVRPNYAINWRKPTTFWFKEANLSALNCGVSIRVTFSNQELLCVLSSCVVPVASKTQGIKTIMIPLSPTEVLFVENRQKLGFDQRLESSWTGLIVYKFNSIAESGQGPLRLICRNSKKEVTAANCVLKPGQSLNVEGFLLQNIRSFHDSYLVKVTSDDDTRVYVRNQASVHDRVPVISRKT